MSGEECKSNQRKVKTAKVQRQRADKPLCFKVLCYGRSTVVSNLDVGGVVLNVDSGSWQDLDYVEVRTTEQWINTQGEMMRRQKYADV
jgi:hypothetical protein